MTTATATAPGQARTPQEVHVTVDRDTAEDAKVLAVLKRWLPAVVMGSTLLFSLATAGVMFSTRLLSVESRLSDLQVRGTPTAQQNQTRIAQAELAAAFDRTERLKDHDLLLKIDRKLSLLICKGDNTKCSE